MPRKLPLIQLLHLQFDTLVYVCMLSQDYDSKKTHAYWDRLHLRKSDICAMSPGVPDTNTLTDKQYSTDSTGLNSLMYIAVLVLRGWFIAFPYRHAAQMGRGKAENDLVVNHWYPWREGN